MFHGFSINIEIEKRYSIQILPKLELTTRRCVAGIIRHWRIYPCKKRYKAIHAETIAKYHNG